MPDAADASAAATLAIQMPPFGCRYRACMSVRGGKIRVLIVESDTTLRAALATRLAQHPFVDVIGTAKNSQTGLPKVAALKPDWVVIDLISNPTDGLAMLEVMKANKLDSRRAIIADTGMSDLDEARAAGVAAVVHCSAQHQGERLAAQLGDDLLAPILQAAGARVAAQVSRTVPSHTQQTVPSRVSLAAANGAVRKSSTTRCGFPSATDEFACRVVGIGASTGGPAALREVLSKLPASFPLPIVVVQHMPASFTASLARSLDQVCALPVAEARGGELITGGQVLIARGGSHMRVQRGSTAPVIQLTEDPPELSCRPSVDYLFRSLADTFAKSTLAVMLTGMGEDGWLGSRAIHQAGGRVLAQDEASCVVFGMPRGPIEAGIAQPVTLSRVAAAITTITGQPRCS
jgi:two-component system, chemotaxis family, protein-glutamate methylesterase/glutaminase